jgi:hypothetical protein
MKLIIAALAFAIVAPSNSGLAPVTLASVGPLEGGGLLVALKAGPLEGGGVIDRQKGLVMVWNT